MLRLVGVLSAALCLSACGTLNGLSAPGSDGKPNASVQALTELIKTAKEGCGGRVSGGLTFAPPLPPSGHIEFDKTCGDASKSPPTSATDAP